MPTPYINHVLTNDLDFSRDQANMILHAAKKLGVEVLKIANFVYSASILDHWDTEQWSVSNICSEYEALTAVYVGNK